MQQASGWSGRLSRQTPGPVDRVVGRSEVDVHGCGPARGWAVLLARGVRPAHRQAVGGAVVSEKHANFIINKNNATATDIETLIELIQKTVDDKHGVLLQTEVKIVGKKKAGEKKS